MKTNGQPYYIGLDMGTNSVGWAVTNENYKILRGKGKDLWGVRLFDEAETAAERRTYRVARRRRQRETARIGLLREYFTDAIHAIDPGFFQRLAESKYHLEDRDENNQQQFALFCDKNFTDKEYYAAYPTIFHLRKALIESSEPMDVRLVYLAILNLFKRRGHFLNKGLSADDGESSMAEAYQTLVEEAREYRISLPEQVDVKVLEACLGEKGLSRMALKENLQAFLLISKKDKAAIELAAMICGLKGTLQKIYGVEIIDDAHKSLKLSFRDMDYEEKSAEIIDLIGEDRFALLEAAKTIHDSALLAHILEGERYLSMARVKQYEAHHEDLLQLKRVLKKYNQNAYHEMFRTMGNDNYSAYVGSVNYNENKVRRNGGKGKDRETFYKHVKKVLNALPMNAQEDPDVVSILAKIESETFLQKQLTAGNGIIPNQIHLRELRAILKNAAQYLDFLNEKDDSGLTVAERIIELYRFQIPYYVGPLGQAALDKKGGNAWAKRRPGEEKGRILPWNFEQKIDVDQAAEDFIIRMVRHCTYLRDENTLPKQSLLYEKFMVLNELNNLRIRGEKPSVEVKQRIYGALFATGKRVTRKKLLGYLTTQGIINEGEGDAVSGFDQDFKASLSSLNKFRGVLGDAALYDSNREMIEQIIFWGTVFGDDKRYLKTRIKERYGERLNDDQIQRICGMKFSGWGNLSRAFLEMEGASKEDGIYRSIIQALWETNDNLMQLLSERYTYSEELAKMIGDSEKPLTEWTIEDLDDMYLSPSVKRMVWQTLKIVNEIVAVRGYAPDKIFVEMARDSVKERARNKGKRTQSRKEFLLNVFKDDQEWQERIKACEDDKFRQRKIYLYFLQHGKSMYSGKTIDFGTLLSDNNAYDIDHIYPRHFIKDDSLENNLVLCLKTENANIKKDKYPLSEAFGPSMVSKQKPVWKHLLDQGAITQEKYNRLIRNTGFSDEELAGFIRRQIVETRQGTKAITEILQEAFKKDKTRIVFTRAEVVSDFRHKFDIPKVRSINDTHHAVDAYLNIVAGNVYDAKFTSHPIHFIKDCRKKGRFDYNMDKVFDYNVKRGNQYVWIAQKQEIDAPLTITQVKKQLQRHTVLLSRRSYMAHGGISNKGTIYGKKIAKPESYLPVKSSDARLCDVTKYGGITSVLNIAYALVEYTVKGETVRSLEAIPLYLGVKGKDDPALQVYLQETLQRENKKGLVEHLSVRMYPVRQRSLVKLDGYYYSLGGMTGNSFYLLDAVPLYLPDDFVGYIKKLEKAVEKQYYDEVDNKGNRIISSLRNIELFNILWKKLETGIYINRRNSIGEMMKKNSEVFASLVIEDQCYVLLQILSWFNTTQQLGVDMKKIGGLEHTGILKAPKKVSIFSEAVLIEQSVTGLYERKIDLLTV